MVWQEKKSFNKKGKIPLMRVIIHISKQKKKIMCSITINTLIAMNNYRSSFKAITEKRRK